MDEEKKYGEDYHDEKKDDKWDELEQIDNAARYRDYQSYDRRPY